MSEIDHVAYFRQRAASERELARTAPAPYIAQIHSEMAERYEALIEAPIERERLWIVGEARRPPDLSGGAERS